MQQIDQLQSDQLQSVQQIDRLQSVKSNHTSLISYYIAGNSNLSSVSSHITKELAASNNIKSKHTRKDVISALKSIQHDVKNMKKMPEYGTAIFASSNSYV